MGSQAKSSLVDASGNAFSDRIQDVLSDLLPKLVRHFPSFKDDLMATEVLEEAARRIADHERRRGPVEKLHGFAWVTVRNVARSRMQRGSMRLQRAMLSAEESRAMLALVPSQTGSPERVEQNILLEEFFAQLPLDERMLFILKRAGFSSRQIARRRGSSVSAVDTLFCRVKEKLRKFMRLDSSVVSVPRSVVRATRR
jgi:RNA polymerase sigma factor (sigma-70 family)